MEINNLDHLILQGRNEFVEEIIQIDGNGIFIGDSYFNYISELIFFKCIFKGNILEFEGINNPKLSIIFNDCFFDIDIKFDNCSFRKLQFLDTKKIKCIEVTGGNFDNLYFRNNNFKEKKENELNGELSFDDLTIKENVKFDNLNLSEGNFEFSNITVLESENSVINFEFSDFQNAKFIKNTFNIEANFNELQTTNNCKFENCKFQKSNFSDLRFGEKGVNEINFDDCKFLGTTIFHYIYGEIYGKLSFESCFFEKYVQFNSSKLHLLSLSNLHFNNFVSFQDVFLDEISIENVIFEKQANFDNIQIKQIDNCDRKTIRAIKLQLQKAENKIDYNRFRVFEFNAYRKDISKKLEGFKKDENKFYHRLREPIQLNRDLVILNLTERVSDYGTDWKRALNFTLFFGSILFLLFYSVENRNQSIDILSYYNWSLFISGLFRFFLVTDFFNPLANDRIYLTNPISWLLFIIGKIIISFGLYEMVQSFRKFKA
jgi:hypothetical protein